LLSNINEGSVASIQHINVVGNSVFFSDEDLIGDLFELKTTNWLSTSSGMTIECP
jgi:outer membrane protein insertion porin family